MATAGPRRGSTIFVFVTVLLDTLGIGIIIPVAPRLVASFLGGDLPAASRWFGVLMTVYSVMQFLFAPVLGGMSDRFGRRTVILGSLFGASLSYLLSGFAPALSWLVAGRVIAGITGASFSAANAYVADVTPPEKRAASFGLIGAAFGLGFIIGPGVGGLLGSYGLRVPYFAAAGLNFVNFLYGVFVLPESLRREDRRAFSLARANPLGSLKNLGRHPIVLGLTGTLACGFMAQWILQSVWALSNQGRFGWSLREVGESLMVVGVASTIVQGGLVRPVIRRLGERRTLLVGLAMGALGHLGFGLARAGWIMVAMIFPFTLAGVAGPATQAIITIAVGPSEQGELQGSLNSLQGLAAIVAPLIGSDLYARFGSATSQPEIPGAPFLAAALLDLVGLALAVRVFRRTRSRSVAEAVGS